MEGFVIENNILKGAPENLETEYYNVGQYFLDKLNNDPQHVAQIDAGTGRQTTFAEMKDRSVRCALWLKEQGIGRGDIITSCTHNQQDAYIPFLASFYVGATFNAWPENTALKRVQYLLNMLRPKVIFANEETVDMISEAVKLESNNYTKIIVFAKRSNHQTLDHILQCYSDDEIQSFEPQNVEPDEIAVILLSSGSTGPPKGVMHSYKNIVTMNTIKFGIPEIENTVALCYSSQYWVSGFLYMMSSFVLSTNRIIHKEFDPERTSQIIEKYKVQWFFMGITAITYLSKSNAIKKYDLSSLKYILTGGSKINTNALEDLKKKLPNTSIDQIYGMTEIGGPASCSTKFVKNNTSVGIVSPYTQLKFVDLITDKALGPNKRGEVLIKTPMSMTGYFENPKKTKETIDEEGWVHSGDIGYYDENGEIYIVDRIKDVMKFRGHHVSPTEIEDILLSHPDVMEVGVTSISHDLDGDWPIALVKKASEAKITEEELIKMSTVLGENQMLRGGVKFVEDLPKTASDKLMRVQLKEMAKTLTQIGIR